MKQLAGLAATAAAFAEGQNNLLEFKPQVIYYSYKRKAARNHHRRMKASGRHNWRASK